MEKNTTAKLTLEETIEQRRKEVEEIYAADPPGDWHPKGLVAPWDDICVP